MVSPGAHRLGEAIRSERARRWRKRGDFAAACGLKERVVAAVENAERENFSQDTLSAIEGALGWAPGSAMRVKAGLRPLRAKDPLFNRLREVWWRLSPDARRMLVDLAERAAER